MTAIHPIVPSDYFPTLWRIIRTCDSDGFGCAFAHSARGRGAGYVASGFATRADELAEALEEQFG